MSTSGGIKFMKKSKNLYADGALISCSSGDASGPFCIDRNTVAYWRSVSSNDATTETITVTFTSSTTIDRIFLIDHNWKGFVVKYDLAGTYTHFASVVGIDGSKANITETTFADDTAYYEFTPVTTSSIQITITTTQTANQEKYLNNLICTEELGTLAGYPKIGSAKHDRNIRKKEMLSGKVLVQKSEESFSVDLSFDNYPASLSADIDLMFYLHDLEENFIIWLCGGRRGTTYFKKQLKGFRLRDVYTCQITAPLGVEYNSNMYKNPVKFSVKIEEAVD